MPHALPATLSSDKLLSSSVAVVYAEAWITENWTNCGICSQAQCPDYLCPDFSFLFPELESPKEKEKPIAVKKGTVLSENYYYIIIIW